MPTTCFPTALGVPGLGGAPNWFDNSATPPRPFDNSTDDPRWRGAMSHSYGTGSVPTAHFRALSGVEGGQTVMYLSWLVRSGPVNPGTDQVLVGLSMGTTGIIVKIAPNTAAAVTAGDSTNYSIDVFVKSAASPTFSTTASASPDPAWIAQRTRVWVNYTPPGGSNLAWAVQMVVPMNVEISPEPANSVILNSGVDFKMWYGVYLGVVDFGAVEYSWPGTPGIGAGFPTLASFQDARIAGSIEEPACTAEGIEIAYSGIGTKNVDGTARATASRIQVDLVNDPPTADSPNEQNLFFAQPVFPAGYTVARKESVRARFRMANWGSQVGVLTSNSWTDIPGGEDVPFVDANGECRFVWPLPADLGQTPATDSELIIDDIRNGVKTTHQCILVQLSSVFAGGETFLVESVYRNMDFVQASTFERQAEISVVGLDPIGAGPRDVYLFVETRNMPPIYPPGQKDRGGRSGRRSTSDLMAASAAPGAGGLSALKDPGFPTYIVHAYHDTGVTTTLLDGAQRRILHAQTSYGYFVGHDGQLFGWNSALQGAKLIAPRLYQVGVPNNGSVKVTNRIEAIEKRGCSYYLWLLLYNITRLFNRQ